MKCILSSKQSIFCLLALILNNNIYCINSVLIFNPGNTVSIKRYIWILFTERIQFWFILKSVYSIPIFFSRAIPLLVTWVQIHVIYKMAILESNIHLESWYSASDEFLENHKSYLTKSKKCIVLNLTGRWSWFWFVNFLFILYSNYLPKN